MAARRKAGVYVAPVALCAQRYTCATLANRWIKWTKPLAAGRGASWCSLRPRTKSDNRKSHRAYQACDLIDPSHAPTPTPTSTPTRRPPTRTPTPSPTATRPPIVFGAKPNPIGRGRTILSWAVDGVKSVRLNNEGVKGRAQREVCLFETTTFLLRVKFMDDSTLDTPLIVTVNPLPLLDDKTPPPPPRQLFPDDTQVKCAGSTTLTWSETKDFSGIIRYDRRVQRYIPNTDGVGYTPIATGSTAGTTPKVPIECWRVRYRFLRARHRMVRATPASIPSTRCFRRCTPIDLVLLDPPPPPPLSC